MSQIVATYVVASRQTKCRPTRTLTARSQIILSKLVSTLVLFVFETIYKISEDEDEDVLREIFQGNLIKLYFTYNSEFESDKPASAVLFLLLILILSKGDELSHKILLTS